VAPFGISNTYGLFLNMTTSRPEIIIQGSRDGKTWKAYEFDYKPDDLEEAPPIVAPHQPRIDWQMWFAALNGDVRRSQWLQRFIGKLFQNERSVTAFLERNPFPSQPPNYIRAVVYEYTFTDNWGSDAWWKRTKKGVYLKPVARERVLQ